ncbi:MAG: hypothetical protein QF752_09565 [Planctomycetota bacterium]|jgi:type II secretory pathway component PulF|nr:hypothetical protein [Planctomycetota bacterium]
MPVFDYDAVDSKGKIFSDEMEAPSVEEVITQIHEMGCLPTRVREKKGQQQTRKKSHTQEKKDSSRGHRKSQTQTKGDGILLNVLYVGFVMVVVLAYLYYVSDG